MTRRAESSGAGWLPEHLSSIDQADPATGDGRLTPSLLFWEGSRVHCSVWRFVGDPDDLEERYLAVLAEVPESNHVLHAAAKTPDGLLIFDTCPSEEVYRAFFAEGGPASALFEKHGLVPTTREDYPVIRAFGAQSRLDE